MQKNSENSLVPAQNKGFLAVLFLSPPPNNENLVDWYWRRVAGVPFLLRNVLNIQRGGVSHLILFAGNEPKSVAKLHNRISQDPRVTLQLEHISDSQELRQATQVPPDLLFLDGSGLYEKTQIRSAIGQRQDAGNNGVHASLCLDKESMASLLELKDTFDFARLERMREQSVNTTSQSPDSEKKSLLYFPEANHPRISKESDFELEGERIIQKSGGLSNDSLATRLLSRPVSKLMTRLLINTRFTPNQITVLSFILGLGSAFSFFQGGYQMGLMGAGLLLASIWVDGVDGEIARIKFMESEFGGKLDILCDNIVHIAVFFSIGMGLFHTHGAVVYIVLGALAAIGSLISFLMIGAAVTAGKAQANAVDAKNSKKSDFVDKLANRDFTHFLFVLALIDRLDVFLWLTAIGVNLLSVYLLFLRRRSSPVATEV
jgi:phosphatidylglycerophosphate synthase